MTTHTVNQELARHHYATLVREASSHRLVKDPEGMSDGAVAPSRVAQITWAVRGLLALRPAIASV